MARTTQAEQWFASLENAILVSGASDAAAAFQSTDSANCRRAQAKLVLEHGMSSDLWHRASKHGTAGAILTALRTEFLHVNAQQQCAVLVQLLDVSCSGKILSQFLSYMDALRFRLLSAKLGDDAFVEKFSLTSIPFCPSPHFPRRLGCTADACRGCERSAHFSYPSGRSVRSILR